MQSDIHGMTQATLVVQVVPLLENRDGALLLRVIARTKKPHQGCYGSLNRK